MSFLAGLFFWAPALPLVAFVLVARSARHRHRAKALTPTPPGPERPDYDLIEEIEHDLRMCRGECKQCDAEDLSEQRRATVRRWYPVMADRLLGLIERGPDG